MTKGAITRYALTPREHGKSVWLHKTKPVWVAEYHRRGVHEIYFQAYRATVPVPEGMKPWDVPNKRLGEEIHGFNSLDAAARAGDEA